MHWSAKMKMFRYGENRVVVLTGFQPDAERWETAVSHPRYGGGNLILVDWYEGSEDFDTVAEAGHNRWIETLTAEKLPRCLERIDYFAKDAPPKLLKSYNRGPRIFEIGEPVEHSPCETLVDDINHTFRFLEDPLGYIEFNDEQKQFIESHKIKLSFNHQGFFGMICRDHLIFKIPVTGIMLVEAFSDDITGRKHEIATALQNIVFRSKDFISKIMLYSEEELDKAIDKGMVVSNSRCSANDCDEDEDDDDDDEDYCNE